MKNKPKTTSPFRTFLVPLAATGGVTYLWLLLAKFMPFWWPILIAIILFSQLLILYRKNAYFALEKKDDFS